MAKNLIIGTAGHIDHGKTTLIKALTGTDTDRLREEKERGISIDLGFTSLQFSTGQRVGIIDVPGHEKFIKNMLAGAGGVDIALLVIAADEGFMAQTEEHLAILNLLNVKKGVVALTKIDLVDEDWLELVQEDTRGKLKGTFLEKASIIPVSPVQGEGLDKLKKELEKLTGQIPDKTVESNVYYPVDRVFTLTGHGTVVTGTLIKGTIQKEDNLYIYPGEIETRVRSLEVHGKQVEKAFPGQRVGINLAGIDKSDIKRGDVLATPESLIPSEYLDAELKLLPSLDFTLSHGDRIRLHLGAGEVMGRVYLLDKEELYPGEKGFIQLRLEEKVVADFKQPFVLRRYSPLTTIGGGEILDTHPVRHRKDDQRVLNNLNVRLKGTTFERLELTLRQRKEKPLSKNQLVKETGLSLPELSKLLDQLHKKGKLISFDGGEKETWLHNKNYLKLKEELLDLISNYHQKYHLRQGMPQEEVRSKLSIKLNKNEFSEFITRLVEEGEIEIINSYLKLVSFEVELNQEEEKIAEEIMAKYQNEKYTPPDLQDLYQKYDSEVINALLDKGVLIKVSENICFHKDAVLEAKKMLIAYLKEHGKIKMATFRDLIESSRKYALPLLEFFDREGITSRQGDIRQLLEKNL